MIRLNLPSSRCATVADFGNDGAALLCFRINPGGQREAFAVVVRGGFVAKVGVQAAVEIKLAIKCYALPCGCSNVTRRARFEANLELLLRLVSAPVVLIVMRAVGFIEDRRALFIKGQIHNQLVIGKPVPAGRLAGASINT